MQPIEKLGLHSHILPALDNLVSAGVGAGEYDFMFASAKAAKIFDGRSLHSGFVEETGVLRVEELKAIKSPLRLPFPNCYFEFSDVSVLCEEFNVSDEESDTSSCQIGIYPFDDWDDWFLDDVDDLQNRIFAYGEINNFHRVDDEEPPPFSTLVNCPEWKDAQVDRAIHLAVGTITLLSENLVADVIERDTAPRLTKARVTY
jgi:hypothetical protein